MNVPLKPQGPIDGVLAFSQGACLTAMLCRLLTDDSLGVYKQKYDAIKFRFAILVAGFKSGQTQHAKFFSKETKCFLPTMHVIGDTDKVIPCDLSTELLDCFENPSVFRHSGGHFVPVNADAKNSFVEFLNKFQI